MSDENAGGGQNEAIEAVEVRHNPWIMGLALSPIAALIPLWIAAVAIHPAIAAFSFHLLAAGLVATLFAWRMNPRPRRVPVDVSVDGEAITLRDRDGQRSRRILRSKILRGTRTPGAGKSTIRLAGRRRMTAQLETEDESAARRILSQLGLDASQTTATFSTMSRIHARTRNVFALFGAFGAGMGLLGVTAALTQTPALMVLPPFLMIALMVVAMARAGVDVGGDGVLIRWLGTKRFIAHEAIERTEITEHGFGRSRRRVVVLHLKGGETVNLPTGAPRLDAGNAETLAARIAEAKEARHAGALAPAAMLFRGEQSHRDWVTALRRRDASDLRSQAVNEDDLWRVIENASAAPVDRAAAVVALGKTLTAAQRERLARTAKVTAAPKLRVVLEAPDDAEDEALAEMLEALEEKRSG